MGLNFERVSGNRMGMNNVIETLKRGQSIINKEGGNSMLPLIKSKQPVKIEPVNTDLLEKGDIVYVKVRGRIYTHLVWSVRGSEVQIGNNKNHANGWTPRTQVFGIITEIEGVPVRGASEKVKRNE